MEIDQFRREYLQANLHRHDLLEDPMEQFEIWLAQVVAAGLTDPSAMVVATVDARQQPWQRIVLLKDVSQQGFVFYTNTQSRKALDIADNPQVSLLFPWNVLERQVIAGGLAEPLDPAESARYFHTRPRDSQLVAWASAQSRPLAARAVLEEKVQQLRQRFRGGAVPVPPFWGGYRVRPQRFEFWQGGSHRMHDRFEYTRNETGGWSIQRLEP